MKLSLLVTAVDARIGGVMVFGDRGTGKSTAVRALAALLPPIPAASAGYQDGSPRKGNVAVPFVDLPLGATEDRVVGALDLERALGSGIKAFEPGLLARANGGFLYIDEVNLLEDHIVDLLLDVAASGENVVEREGLSVRHPARFVLVGSGNPEEGELRPQLLDRFGLSVEVRTPQDLNQRVEILKRCDAFERSPEDFAATWRRAERKTLKRIARAREALPALALSEDVLAYAARLCIAVGADGLRGELTLMRAARALAALDDAPVVTAQHIARIAPMALRHRLRRNVLDETGSTVRIERALQELAA
ncbi:Magnesium-chelatase subunit [Sphingomonas antarctica]